MSVSDEKKMLRRNAETARAALALAAPEAGPAIADRFFSAIELAPLLTIAGYLPTRSEADPLPLLTRLRAQGFAVALPRVTAKNTELDFHLWPEGAAPARGAFGLEEADRQWPRAAPDILLVPLLAFDVEGYRLGYGGGFYDRTLRARRAARAVIAVGIAFSGQKHPVTLPRDDYDERLDWVVTEKDALKFERN
ncbi:MAG: hypothetical protein RJB62_476 [Pseudomonadota bacterium]|jgi:5-formyltetrahydrofolate cyclo-ligase